MNRSRKVAGCISLVLTDRVFSASSKASVALRSLRFQVSRCLQCLSFHFLALPLSTRFLVSTRLDIEANQNTLGVGKIADDLSDRLR